MNPAMDTARPPGRVQWMLHATLVALSLLTLFPLAIMVLLSLKDRAQIYGQFWSLPNPIRWENLADGVGLTLQYIWNSVVVSGGVVVLVVVCGALAAYAFVQLKYPGWRAIYTSIISLLMIPGILVLVPLYLTTRNLNLLNSYTGLILPQVAGFLPFAIFLFKTFFEQLPKDLFDSARIDGASEWTVLASVVVPLSKPIVSTVVVLNLLSSWNNYVWPLVVVRDEALRTIPLGLVFLFTELNLNNYPKPGLEMACYLVASLPMLIAFFFAMRTFMQGITSGALKI